MKNFRFLAVVLTLITAMQFSLVGCSDDPGLDNYYTTTKEYASDYLLNREQFSEYVKILRRAEGERHDLHLIDMLGTYGAYTVFAPTNEAVAQMLQERGLTTVDSLSVEDCDTIALNSIIEAAYFTTDYSNAQYPRANMLEHIMTISCDTLWDGDDAKLQLYINNSSLLTHADDSVCNGVVHTVGKVVNTSNDLLPSLLEKDSLITLFYDALLITGVNEELEKYVDLTYGFASNQDRIDSCTWTNAKLCIFTAQEYDNVAYPEKRYFNFTLFITPNKVLEEKYNVTTVLGKDDPASLEHLAHEIYDPMYPEDKDNNDYKDKRNALNRFVSYHILDRLGTYYKLTAVDGQSATYLMNQMQRRYVDVCDYYETLMPHSLMKFSFPNGSQQGIYINRRGAQSRADLRGVFRKGAKLSYGNPDGKDNYGFDARKQTAVNGLYYYIDDIATYGEETQTVVLNERMRFDCSVLSPDFMTKLTDGDMARGHGTRHSDNNGIYGYAYTPAGNPDQNKNTCIGFKHGYIRNFEYNQNTHLHVRNRYVWFSSYQGDEVTIRDNFDVKIKLPSVPAGTYEVRMFTCAGFASRGIVQAYIGPEGDIKAQGIPFDMRQHGSEAFGWQSDQSLGDNDAITAFDKAIHNIGWMKGPKNISPIDPSAKWSADRSFRNMGDNIRRVLGTFETDGKTDIYLRMQQKMESGGEMNFDFIEICPSTIYNNPDFAEDEW